METLKKSNKMYTCLILSKAGNAALPALTTTDRGESIESPMSAQASLTNISEISCHRESSKRCAYGEFSNLKQNR